MSAAAGTGIAPPRGGSHPLRGGPGRLLVLVSLLGSLGFGLYQAGSAVYFVRSVGLSATMVGTSLSAAGFVGLFVGLPLGRLADRLGARRVAVTMAAARAVPLLFAVWARSFWQVLVIVLVLGVAESGWIVAEEATIAGLMAGTDRVRIAAYLRAVFNIGLTAGSLVAGVALAVGTRHAYEALIWGYIATSVLGAVLYLGLPAVPAGAKAAAARAADSDPDTAPSTSPPTSASASPPTPPPAAPLPARRALRDWPFLAMSLVTCLTVLGDIVLAPGLPLWIVSHTSAPRSLAAWLMGVNTLLVVLLQVRVAKAADSLRGAMRLQELALIAMVLMCVLAGLSGQVSRWPAGALLVGSVIALTFGEMWGQGARWAMRYTLAPAAAQGEYGAAFRLGLIVPRACGPVLVVGLTNDLRFGGWLLLGALFALAIAATRPVTWWAIRTRDFPVEAGAGRVGGGAG